MKYALTILILTLSLSLSAQPMRWSGEYALVTKSVREGKSLPRLNVTITLVDNDIHIGTKIYRFDNCTYSKGKDYERGTCTSKWYKATLTCYDSKGDRLIIIDRETGEKIEYIR